MTLAAALAAVGILATVGWVVVHLGGAWSLWRIAALPIPDAPGPLPSLSIVIAACNEADNIGPALKTLLAQDYPGLQIIVVNDRSTDDTGAIVEAIAAGDSRVTIVHITELPEGWLGKTNALRQGAAAATGEFILFADADVHFRPGALAAALSHVVREGVDHLTLLPRLHHHTLLHEAIMNSFAGGYASRAILSSRPFGYGAFNLVRRATLERSEGFEWFPMEVIDDMALGLVIARAGGHGRFLIAPEVCDLEWYPSVAAAVHGVEKNAFGAMARYRVGWTVMIVGATLLAAVGPFLPLFHPVAPWVWSLPAIALGALAVHALVARWRLQHSLASGFLIPVANLIIAWGLVLSTIRCRRQGGIVWRGTLYPIEKLIKGRKIAFP